MKVDLERAFTHSLDGNYRMSPATRDALIAELEAARKVVEAAKSFNQDPDEICMVPIGGGNPYYHCKSCGVTNVELNMGEHSRKHEAWCEWGNIAELNDALLAYSSVTATASPGAGQTGEGDG